MREWKPTQLLEYQTLTMNSRELSLLVWKLKKEVSEWFKINLIFNLCPLTPTYLRPNHSPNLTLQNLS